jgi:hypothetical protein
MLVSALAVTPIMPTTGSVAPYARPRAMWQASSASMPAAASAAMGLGFGSPACITPATDHKTQGTEINAKDHVARRLRRSFD